MSKQNQINTPLSEPPPHRADTFGYAITALIFFALGFLIAGLVGFQIFGDPLLEEKQVQVAVIETLTALTPQPTLLPTDVPVALTYSADHFSRGDEDAPIKLVEFSDFQCPYCAAFAIENLEPLMEIYDGYVQFIYRDFPILGYGTTPDMSVRAAHAAACADQQDKYWEYHHSIFEHQQDERISQEMLQTIAEDLSLDMDAFNVCIADDSMEQDINAEFAQGLGLLGNAPTPTFLLNGKRFAGNAPLETFIEAINSELEALGIEPPPAAVIS